MRAVNLVPPESRAGRVNPGKSGGAVYGLLVGLVVVLLMVVSMASTHKQKAQAEQELAAVQQSTQAAEQVATQYTDFAKAAQDVKDRITLVRSIADARFDWAGALRDLARVIPAHTQISALDASVKPGTAVGGGSSELRGAMPTPAIALTGCSINQATVADLITRLQAMRRVTNVTLESSETKDDGGSLGKTDNAGANDDSTAACSLKNPYYTFTLTVFYAQGKATSSDAVGATTPTGTTVAATTPATSTTGK